MKYRAVPNIVLLINSCGELFLRNRKLGLGWFGCGLVWAGWYIVFVIVLSVHTT